MQVTDAKAAIKALENIGYSHSGEWNIPFKYGLTLRQNININLHMFDFNHPAIESNLLFRDYLRNNAAVRDKYAQLKYKILEQPDAHRKKHPFLYNYTLEKDEFIKQILRKTGFNKIYMQFMLSPLEENRAQYFKKTYSSKFVKISDNNGFIIEKNNNILHDKDLILYKGMDIVGYAKVLLAPEGKLKNPIIAIDKEYQNHSYHEIFTQLIHKWTKKFITV